MMKLHICGREGGGDIIEDEESCSFRPPQHKLEMEPCKCHNVTVVLSSSCLLFMSVSILDIQWGKPFLKKIE